MKFFSTALTFAAVAAGFVANAASIPARAAAPAPVEVEAEVGLKVGIEIVTGLLADVKECTGSINKTIAGYTVETKAVVVADVKVELGKIVTLFNGAISNCKKVAAGVALDLDVEVEVDITLEGLIALVVELVIEVLCTLEVIIKCLGLDVLAWTIVITLCKLITALLVALCALPCTCGIASLLDTVLATVGGLVGGIAGGLLSLLGLRL